MCDPVTMAALGSTAVAGAETAALGGAVAAAPGTLTLAAAPTVLAPVPLAGALVGAPAAFAMPSLVGPASIASSVMGSFQQRNAGISQDYALKQQAAQEGIKAREEGIIRREKLLNALALQGARTGASGITGMTPKSIALTDIQNFQDEQDMADLGSKLSQNNSRRAGSNARATSKLGAGISLIDNYINYDKVR